MVVKRMLLAIAFTLVASTALADNVDNDVFGQYQSLDGSMKLDLSASGSFDIYPAAAGGRGRMGTFKAWGGQWQYLPMSMDGPNETGTYKFNGPSTLIITTDKSGTVVWKRTSAAPANFGYGQELYDPATGLPCPSGGCSHSGFVGKYAQSGGIVGPLPRPSMGQQMQPGGILGPATQMLNGGAPQTGVPEYGNQPMQPGFGTPPMQPGYGAQPTQPYGPQTTQPGYGAQPMQPGDLVGQAVQMLNGGAPQTGVPGYGNQPMLPGNSAGSAAQIINGLNGLTGGRVNPYAVPGGIPQAVPGGPYQPYQQPAQQP